MREAMVFFCKGHKFQALLMFQIRHSVSDLGKLSSPVFQIWDNFLPLYIRYGTTFFPCMSDLGRLSSPVYQIWANLLPLYIRSGTTFFPCISDLGQLSSPVSIRLKTNKMSSLNLVYNSSVNSPFPSIVACKYKFPYIIFII